MGNTTQKQQKRRNVYVSYTVTKNLGVFPAKAQSTAGKKCYTVAQNFPRFIFHAIAGYT